MKVIIQELMCVLIMALSVLTVAGSDAQEQDEPLNPEYEKLVEQLRDPSSAIRGRAYAKLIKLGLSARLEITAALLGSNAQERDKPQNPEYEKLVEQLGDPSFAVRQQAFAKLLEIGLSARAEVTAALNSPDPEIRYRARLFVERFTPIGLGEYLLQNPREIASLKPRQARELVGNSPKVEYLFLQGLKSIDKDVAGELAKFEGNCLYLIGVESIDEDIARELASFKGDLLEKSPGWLRLRGLVAIDKDVARELAKFEGAYLDLTGLESIDIDVASELASYTGHLDLQGLKSVDKAVAQELAKYEGRRLGLNGLESIDQDVARELASLKGALGLSGLKSIDKDVAQELAQFEGGSLSFPSLNSIDKDVARELAKFEGKYLNLQGLKSIDKDTARELSKFESHGMYLTGLTSIDRDILEILKSNPAIKLPRK